MVESESRLRVLEGVKSGLADEIQENSWLAIGAQSCMEGREKSCDSSGVIDFGVWAVYGVWKPIKIENVRQKTCKSIDI